MKKIKILSLLMGLAALFAACENYGAQNETYIED